MTAQPEDAHARRPEVPVTTPSAADRAVLVGLVVLLAAAVALELSVLGWWLVLLLMWAVLWVPVLVVGIVVVARIFGRRSAVRSALGRVPGRYHALAWAWAAQPAIVMAFALDGGDADPWTSPVVELVLAGTVPDWYQAVQNAVVGIAAILWVALLLALLLVRRRDLEDAAERARTGVGPGESTPGWTSGAPAGR